MRILIVFAFVGLLGWWVYNTSQNGFNVGFVNGAMSKLTGAGTTMLKPPSNANDPKPTDSSPVKTPSSVFVPAQSPQNQSQELPSYSTSYVFKHREAPSVNDVTIAGSVGCTISIDTFSRTAVIVGPVSGVDICLKFLKQIDVVSGSCAVKSWAVFVDKSAQTGFDLVTAINSVVDSDGLNVRAGSGTLTLDVGVDDLAVALTAICDGSVVEVVQRPHVQLQHQKVAKIESLQEVPIPSVAVSQGLSQTSVEYRKVGLQLEVTPYFLDSSRLRLGVVQTNGLLGQNVRIGENEVPVIQSQTVSTSIELSVGQTVLLGGVSTYREKLVKGILSDRKEVSEGTLYVVISTYYDFPKAIVLDGDKPPITENSVDAEQWLDSHLLPSGDWQKQEREFIRSRHKR